MILKNKLHKYLCTIRARILLCTISLIAFICVIITSISYFLVLDNLRQNLIQTSETRLSFLCGSIDANVDNVSSFIRSCQISTKIINFTKETEPSGNQARREAHDFVMENYSANASLPSQLIRMVIIGKSRKDIVQVVEPPYSSIAISADAIRALPYFESLHDHMEEIATGILPDSFCTSKEIPMIPVLYPIAHPYKAEEIGYIFTEISTSVITDPIRNYLSERDSRFFFYINDYLYQFQNGTLVPYEGAFDVTGDLSDLALNPDTRIQTVRLGNGTDAPETFTIITHPLNTKGWYIAECVDESQLTKQVFNILFSIVLITIAAASCIGIFLSCFLSRTVNVPVKQLQARIRRIENGDFSRDLSTEWPHELGDIGKTINDLSENVLLLMDQRIKDERQKREYEYKMLQSQINPHFLYNTLNSIKWMATIQNSPGIAEMTTSLSRLLKDISKGATNLVSIRHELELLNDYFIIQQYRYGGTITLTFDVENDALLSCQILKFTLQPIVENAIFHGIEPKGMAGSIVIHLYQDDAGDIHIDVTDDGVGMEPELAGRLLHMEAPASSSFFKEIGVSNVHKRLQYEFGAQYGLSIHSEVGKFTTISILLPFREENL
ncbi:MAG: sensor histidine kinase [Blautia sp.]|nr:sensor histidine kinase [Blautia sp.]